VPFRREGPAPGRVSPVGLLRERPGFRNLWLALALSYTGSGAALTALILYAQRSQGTGIAVGAILIAITVPRLVGPVAGTIADRTDLRRLMIGCDTGQVVLYAMLALLPPFGVIIALAALATVLTTAYAPARTALLPRLVEEDELLSANSLIGTAFNMQIAAGPLLGGLLFAAGGASLALWVNAGTFAVSALLTSLVPRVPRAAGEPEAPSGVLGSTREGFGYAMRNPYTRVVILTLLFGLIFLAMDNVALVFLVRGTLEGGAVAFGIASAAFGVGMVAGALGLLRHRRFSPPTLYLAGLGMTAVGTLLTGLSPAIGFVVPFQGLAGAGNGIDNVANETLLQQCVPRPMLGRVFGLTHTAANAGAGIAALLAGVLLDLTSPRVVLITAGIGGLLVMLVGVRSLARNRDGDTSPGG
jgi:MFS family permease